MMGKEVRAKSQGFGKFGGGAIRDSELVDDAHPVGV